MAARRSQEARAVTVKDFGDELANTVQTVIKAE